MKSHSLLKAASAALLVALLAACGGGGDDAAPAPDVAWASPAAFAGASNKSYVLEGCRLATYVNLSALSMNEVPLGQSEGPPPGDLLYNAKLVIAANGDLSISAATTTTGTVSVLWSMPYASMTYSAWSVDGTVQTPSYSLSSYQQLPSMGGKSFNARSSLGGGEIFAEENSGLGSESTSSRLSCGLTQPLALQFNPTSARAAKNLGSAAGVTTYDNRQVDGRIEGANAFWFNDSASAQYSNVRFNLASGELSSSASATGTYSAISLALPSTNSEFGVYGETLERNNSYFDNVNAKSICLGRDAGSTGFQLYATAYGNKFMPSSGRFFLAGLEAPQVITKGGCGLGFI